MMKRMIAIAALVSALAVQPAMAQSPALASSTASASDADLFCAAWTASIASKAKTEKEKLGLTLLMTFFIGRWEGATGRSIEEGLTLDYLTANLTRLEGANPDCMERARAFGQRLQQVGNRLKNQDNAN
jgi:hypothetical protein